MEHQYTFEEYSERAILVGLVTGNDSRDQINDYLDELEFLLETAGGTTIGRFVQYLDSPNPGTFIGSGKLNEIQHFIENNQIDLVVFDDELTGSQLRNIEKALQRKILDRTNLILDIFAKRARTAHAKTQVELAQYEYLLPRLAGMWTHLERQKGGIGLRGPGEREIETDRRIIRNRIALLKSKLREIDKQKATQRGNRGKMIRVALVGYTNVGKSTLMNLLSKSDVFAENKLFATLDTTVRKVIIGNLPFLLSDTVGFIRKLPHSLIESFKSTLDEVRESDLLIHVVDISHPDFGEQINIVNQTLTDIGAAGKPTLLVFNKTDAYTYIEKDKDDLSPANETNISLEDLKKSWMGRNEAPVIFVSAKKKTNTDELRRLLYKQVRQMHIQRYPYNDFLYPGAEV